MVERVKKNKKTNNDKRLFRKYENAIQVLQNAW